MKTNLIENKLNEVQKRCTTNKISIQQVVLFNHKIETITKKIKKYDTENLIKFSFEYNYGGKTAGFAHPTTCIKGICTDKGSIKNVEIFRDKKGYSNCRLTIENYEKLPKLIRHLLEEAYGFTRFGHKNL